MAVLNLVASNYLKAKKENTVKAGQSYSVLKTSVVYGANASGKTKLFLAFHFMRFVVLHSDNTSDEWKSLYDPFRLSVGEEGIAASTFEAVFLIDGIQYRYGFELDREAIRSEWLFRKDKKEVLLLYRDEDGVETNEAHLNKKIARNLKEADMVRRDTLYLTALSKWNDPLARKLSEWFFDCNVLSTSIDNFMGYSMGKLDTPMKEKMLSLMTAADIAIEDLIPNEIASSELPEEVRKALPEKALAGKIYNGVRTVHKVYDSSGLRVDNTDFLLEKDESYGTVRLFALSAPIIDTLENGKVLWVDEIGNGLHPELLEALVKLFHNPEVNRKNAQLIINTHCLSLIGKETPFRKDQIYFVGKDRYGKSWLKPLSGFKGVRINSSIGKMYREGRFGAVPYLAGFESSLINKCGK